MNNINITLTAKHFVTVRGTHFASAHASTLVSIGRDTRVIACFGGTREGHEDVGIYIFRESGYRRILAAIIKVAELAHFNPVLYRRTDGTIVCWFKVGRTPRDWKTWASVSYDDGRSWEEPMELGGDFGPVKNKPLLLSSGILCAPYSTETDTDWTVHGAVSYDEGMTWVFGDTIEYVDKPSYSKRSGVIQPSLWEDDTGVHMLMRSTWGQLWRADSKDGITWSRAYATDIPNNNSGIDLVRTDSGVIALLLNPTSGDFVARTPLVLRLSFDNGSTFTDALTLEDAPGEYSYPAVIADGNRLCMTYTWNRETVVYAEAVIG